MKTHTTMYKPTHTISVTHTLEESRAAASINSRAQLAEYVSRGFILLTPEDLGVDASIHPRIHQQTSTALNALEWQRAKRQDTMPSGAVRVAQREQVGRGLPPSRGGVQTATPTGAAEEESVTENEIFESNLAAEVPELSEIFASPGLTAAVEGILGPDWAIVPFGSTVMQAGSYDQHWHKDDLLPWNARKPGLRHHHLETIDLFYYPQEVPEAMGPTALMPHSQYWTFDHDENNDNICLEFLDYNFVREKMGANPDLAERDRRLDSAVAGTQWPLVHQVKLCVPAGSVVLMNPNCFHRGQRRSDDPSLWVENPRYMWRFWMYRTTEPPQAPASDPSPSEHENACMRLLPAVDPLTGIPLDSPESTAVWEPIFAWATGAAPPSVATHQPTEELEKQLYLCGDENEPKRVAAAYHLATTAQGVEVLRQAFVDDRESVRRAATHGIVAAGADAACEVALDVALSPSAHKWARKNAAWALGETAPAEPEVVNALRELLKRDHSVHVRATCAASLGLVGRRALRDGRFEVAAGVVSALVECLEREENRLAQDIAQKRGIFDIRPTDESDMCEGSGVFYSMPGVLPQAVVRTDGKPRFNEQVRSAVRENALWAAVTLATPQGFGNTRLSSASIAELRHGMLRVITTDDNIVCFGFALDAFCRLSAAQGGEAIVEAQQLVASEPVVCVANMWQVQRLTERLVM
jgi:hypothetical protein